MNKERYEKSQPMSRTEINKQLKSNQGAHGSFVSDPLTGREVSFERSSDGTYAITTWTRQEGTTSRFDLARSEGFATQENARKASIDFMQTGQPVQGSSKD